MRHLPPLTLISLGFIALMVVVNAARPLLPIDETRYLTVAWEYMTRGTYILPTLNFDPYHHKPPMLFWLINAMWSFFGTTDIWAARLVTLIGSLGTLFMTHQIARVLWPDARQKADIAVFMLGATPFFLIYSSLIMFDALLACAVLVGIYALLRFYQGGSRWNFMLLGLALGAGALIKGPVILLHLLPVILLFPLIRRDFSPSRSLWFQGTIFALLIGTAIGLAWALPAAHLGGPEYKDMIFRGQSADRMVNAFDHARPFWFYLAALPALTLPWIFIAPFYRRGKCPDEIRTWQTRFLLAWILSPFIAFMAISGKQVHYLIPLLPGLALLAAHYIVTRRVLDRLSPGRLYTLALLPGSLAFLGLLGVVITARNLPTPTGTLAQMSNVSLHFLILGLIAVALIARHVRRAGYDTTQSFRAIFAAHVALIICLHLSLAPMMTKYYDLSGVAAIVKPYADAGKPIAVARAWQGELGYLAHLKEPVDIIEPDRMAGWLARHPKGIIILRHTAGKPPKGYKIAYTAPYRSPGKAISLLTK